METIHDDVFKWKHFRRCRHFVRGIHRSPMKPPHKGQWRGALMVSLICAWLNAWVNNREVGDLRRHRAHYYVILMINLELYLKQNRQAHLQINDNWHLSAWEITNYEWSIPWWRHQMETFSVLLTLCAGNSPVTGEFPAQRPVTRSFDAFFDLRLNKRLSKQSWGLWFETPSRLLWRHCNDVDTNM